MKKKVAYLGLTALCLGALAACGSSNKKNNTDAEHVKINIWATAKEEAVIKTVVDKYNAANPNNKFTYKFSAVAEGDCGTTLSKDPTVEGAPALFLVADDHIPSLVSKDIVSEIKGSRKDKVVNNTLSPAVAGATYNDKLWGYPVTNDNGYFLWYNKSALTDTQLGSLEDLLAAAKKAGKHVLMDVPNGWYVNSFFMSPEACGLSSLAWHTDAEGKSYTETTWDGEMGVKVATYINSVLQRYYADGTLVIGGNEVISAGFADGTMIAAVSGTWMEGDLKAAIADNLAATKLPAYHMDGKACQMASFTGSKIYCLNKTRPVAEQKTAADLAALLTDTDAQLVRFETRQSLPCNNAATKDKRYTEHTTIGGAALKMQNQYAAVQAQAAESAYWDIGKAIGQALIDGKLPDSAKTWAAYMKAQMDTLRVHK